MAVIEASHAAARELDDLYRQYGGAVYRYALAVLGNHADAEDVTQTTFLNAYRSLEQGVRPRKPTNWLLTIASNAIKQRFRQEQSRPREVELDRDVAGTSADDETPSVGELLTALSKIPPQQRQAIVLREFEGRSYTEIADILGITTSALETLLFRARRSLSEELEHHLTCTEAQLAISRATDDRLGRKERRRLREHIGECPDCAQFARLQQRHRRALRGLALIPIPLSLSVFKGLQGSTTAAAATLPTVGSGTAVVGSGTAAVTAGSGAGAATATGGGLFAGSVALKAAAVVAAAGVAVGGATVGAERIGTNHGSHSRAPAHATKSTKPARGASALTGAGLGAKGKGKALGTIGEAPGRARSATAPGQTHRKNGGTVAASPSKGKSSLPHGKAHATHGRSATSNGKSSAAQGTNSEAHGKSSAPGGTSGATAPSSGNGSTKVKTHGAAAESGPTAPTSTNGSAASSTSSSSDPSPSQGQGSSQGHSGKSGAP